MRMLEIRLPTRYPVCIGSGLLEEAVQNAPEGPKAVLYDLKVERFADEAAQKLGIEHKLGLQGGEDTKTLAVFARCQSWLAQAALPRNAVLYVIGGGTLTDLGGYVAASYLRGIRYISLPTTTLAVVDASVGGKTGLNLPEGKNLVGAFHFPAAVYSDTGPLATLPTTLFKEGLVEAFKHGMIAGDPSLLDLSRLAPDYEGLEDYLAKAVSVKIDIVEKDPTEQGERRKLNLGHTLAHGLEAATRHTLSHGAAVAYGLLFAALLGRKLGGQDLVPTVQKLMAWLEPAPLPIIHWDALLPYLARDKKKLGNDVHWVVPKDLGRLEIGPVAEETLRETHRELLSLTS